MILRAVAAHLILFMSAFAAEEFEAKSFNGSKGVLPYRILAPATVQAGTKYPLVVFLHGAGERGTTNTNQLHHGGKLFLNPKNRRDFPAFVIFPQCPNGKRWVEVNWGEPTPHTQPKEPSDPMALVMELIPSLKSSLPVDPSGFTSWAFPWADSESGTWPPASRMGSPRPAYLRRCGQHHRTSPGETARMDLSRRSGQ